MHVHEPRLNVKVGASTQPTARRSAVAGPAAATREMQRTLGNQTTSGVVQRARLDFPHSASHRGGGPKPPEPGTADHRSGLALHPKKIKRHEVDDQGKMRLNVAWIALRDLTGKMLEECPRDAKWQYLLDVDEEIYLGSEDVASIVPPEQIDKLHEGMQSFYDGSKADQGYPRMARGELVEKMNLLGHPTIAAEFDTTGATKAPAKALRAEIERGEGFRARTRHTWEKLKRMGAPKVSPRARVSGEMLLENGVWTLNDKSGRYMSKKVRGELNREDLERWMSGAAERISKQTGMKINHRIAKYA